MCRESQCVTRYFDVFCNIIIHWYEVGKEKYEKEEEGRGRRGERERRRTIQTHSMIKDAPISEPEILSTATIAKKKSKEKVNHDILVQESLYIRRFDCGPNRGMNEDWGSYVKTTAWTPVFSRM